MNAILARYPSLASVLALAVSLAAVLSGCGGGDDDTTTLPPPAVATLTLTGTAATGAPAANAAITIVCAGAGTAVTTTAGVDGRFSATVAQAPCLLRATFGSPAQSLYSIATQAGVVDISPFTDLVVAAWGQALPDAVFTTYSANPGAIDATALANALALVKRRVANAGVTIDALDLLGQTFAAQAGDAYDDALEALKAANVPQSTLRADVAAGRDHALPVVVAKPTVPTVTLAEPGDGVARIVWSPVEDGVSYTVHYDVSNSGPGGVAFTKSANGVSPLTLTALTDDTDYIVEVEAANAGGSVTSAFVHVTPKAAGLLFQRCPAGSAGCLDPSYADAANFGAFYVGMAYTRFGGQDVYLAVKSNLQIMRMLDDGTPDHRQFPAGGANLVALTGVAANESGTVLAVGDAGLLMLSQDAGNRWTQQSIGFAGAIAAGIRYTSVTYGNGKFVAVGSYADSFGKPHDLIVTYDTAFQCPVGATCGEFAPLSAYTPQTFSTLTQVAWGDGRFVALGSNNRYTDANGDLQFVNASYTSADATTWTFDTPSQAAMFQTGADKLVFFDGLFWGLVTGSDTGGYRSGDGAAWNGNDWQVTNPGSFISDIAVGLGQMVAVDTQGYTYLNKSGGAARNSWIGSSPTTQLFSTRFSGERNLLVYGDGRYVGISAGQVFVSK